MHSRLPFQLILTSSSGSCSPKRPGHSKNNQSVGVQAVLSNSNKVELVTTPLNQKNCPTTFYGLVPPFLEQVQGFYLGQTIQPQVLVNGQYYYLRLVTSSQSYQLSTKASEANLKFRLTDLNLQWDCPFRFTSSNNKSTTCSVDPFVCPPRSSNNNQKKSSGVFENFSLTSKSRTFSEIIFRSVDSIGLSCRRPTQLVYSPSSCDLQNNATICGTEVCPEDFSLSTSSKVPGACVSDQGEKGRISFGLRYLNSTNQEMVITYRHELVDDQTKVIFQYVSLSQLSLDPNGFRERWFFVDSTTPTLDTGAVYPLYVTFGSGTKLYLIPPRNGTFTRTDQGVIEFAYDTARDASGNVLRFKPDRSGSFNQFIFPQEDFIQLKVPSTSTRSSSPQMVVVALWKGPAYNNVPAVVTTPTLNDQQGSTITTTTTTTQIQSSRGARDLAGTRRKSGTTHVPGDKDIKSTNVTPGVSKRGLNNLVIPPTDTGVNSSQPSFISSWAFFFGVIFVIILVLYLAFVLYQSHLVDINGSPDLDYSPTKTVPANNLTSYWVPLPPTYQPSIIIPSPSSINVSSSPNSPSINSGEVNPTLTMISPPKIVPVNPIQPRY